MTSSARRIAMTAPISHAASIVSIMSSLARVRAKDALDIIGSQYQSDITSILLRQIKEGRK
jgi:hypothetical protein